MPNLPKPRLRRRPAGAASSSAPRRLSPRRPNVETIDADGLRWVNIEHPTPLECAWLEEQFDFHALDLEDVLSRNQRPKIDEYPDYLFIVLHFPVFDRRRTAQRRRARHLRRPRLPGHDPEPAAAAGRVPVRALPPKEELREQLFSQGSGYLLYRIVDDASTTASRCCARSATSSTRSRTRSSRAAPRTSSATSPTSSRRSSTSAR